MENPAERLAERKSEKKSAQELSPLLQQPLASPSVIKFGSTSPKLTPPTPQVAIETSSASNQAQYTLQGPPLSGDVVTTHSSLPPPAMCVLEPVQSTESALPGFALPDLSSRSPSPSDMPNSTQELVIDSDNESSLSQPTDTQMQGVEDADSVSREVSLSPVRRRLSGGSQNGGKARKPKVLELSAPTLVVTSSDLSPMNLYSPSLPTASLTPVQLQTPTLLLTPSPLLSNIHFWSTLSPVAPLSPATRRQQAAHTLFQFPSVLNPQFQIAMHSLDGTNTPGPISPDPQKT